MDRLEALISDGGNILWTYLVLPLVVGLGVYFTARLAFVQVRHLPTMLRTLREPAANAGPGHAQSISSFQAFTVSAASRVGVGNIAGVGTAIALGGPGAIFWMWLMAIIVAAASFVESTLGQLYKVEDREGYRGGPAYYMQHGLGSRAMGIAFAVVLIVCFPFAFSSLQANTIVDSISSTVGSTPDWLPLALAIGLASLTALVIFGGLHRIAEITDKVVPLMALAYLLLGLAIAVINYDQIPWAISHIFADAFTANSVTGAAVGTVILTGVQRGMFSNEAGLGSAPNAGASAAVTHPAKQGLVQTLGVYFDTFIVCSITAFIILLSRPDLASAERGISLTSNALKDGLGSWTGYALAVIIFLLAFSSILGNYFYGEANVAFITENPLARTVLRVLAVVAVFGGSLASAGFVWTLADQIMGVMAMINLVAIALLFPQAHKVWRDYLAQRASGIDPTYLRERTPVRGRVLTWGSEREQTGQEE